MILTAMVIIAVRYGQWPYSRLLGRCGGCKLTGAFPDSPAPWNSRVPISENPCCNVQGEEWHPTRKGTHGKPTSPQPPPLCWKVLALGDAVGMWFRCVFWTASCYGLRWSIMKALYPQEVLRRSSCPYPDSLQVRREGKNPRWMASWWQSPDKSQDSCF